jgi:hypothetical protein
MPRRPPPQTPAALREFVAELLQSTGTLMLMASDMARYPASSDAEPVPDLMTKLLESVLGPLVEYYGTHALTEAAAILGEAREIVCNDIFVSEAGLAPHSGRAHRPATGCSKPRRGCAD